jgi:hypothetical protein
MSKTFNQAVRAAFEREMGSRLPRFEPWREKSTYLWSGERVWRWVPSATAPHYFVLLVTSAKGYNEFTIELGWSTLRRFPQLSVRPSPARPEPEHPEFGREEFLCRLSQVGSAQDRWWGPDVISMSHSSAEETMDLLARAEQLTRAMAHDEARENARSLVADSVSLLIRDGIPYLHAHLSSQSR